MITDTGPFYHGTKADLKVGDLLQAGFLARKIAALKADSQAQIIKWVPGISLPIAGGGVTQ